MTIVEVYKKADAAFPLKGPDPPRLEHEAYVKGYLDALKDIQPETGFYVNLATALRELWPQGEKDGKYPWRGPVPKLAERLEFIWKEYDLRDKYSIDDCLMAARRYLAKFETDAKYMQVLKYFIFKQQKLVGHDGQVKYIYKSSLVDMLESNPVDTSGWSDTFGADSTYDQGELI